MAVGKVADFEEQIKTFKQERGTALRYALEIVMKTTNKQMTIKELRQVGEVHERMRIWMKKPQKEPTSILRAQLMVEQLERRWPLRSMAKIELTAALSAVGSGFDGDQQRPTVGRSSAIALKEANNDSLDGVRLPSPRLYSFPFLPHRACPSGSKRRLSSFELRLITRRMKLSRNRFS